MRSTVEPGSGTVKTLSQRGHLTFLPTAFFGAISEAPQLQVILMRSDDFFAVAIAIKRTGTPPRTHPPNTSTLANRAVDCQSYLDPLLPDGITSGKNGPYRLIFREIASFRLPERNPRRSTVTYV